VQKILIIGSGAAGKSSFARELGERLDVKVIHLDKLFWRPGWIETPRDEWKIIISQLVKGDSWIMDGNHGGTIEMLVNAADTVVLLDLPRTLCVYRVVKRWLTYSSGSRPDIAEGCDERFDLEFLKWIWNYPRRSLPKIESVLAKAGNEKKVIRLRSRKDVSNFIESFRKSRIDER
jgi:adenylate kinase family enzyme